MRLLITLSSRLAFSTGRVPTKSLPRLRVEWTFRAFPVPALIAYLDKIYSNPRYGDFDVEIATELAAMRGINPQSPSSEGPGVNAGESRPLAIERNDGGGPKSGDR